MSVKSNRINDLVNKFVSDLSEAISEDVNERVQEELKRFADGFGNIQVVGDLLTGLALGHGLEDFLLAVGQGDLLRGG